jgi:hypothetical protein
MSEREFRTLDELIDYLANGAVEVSERSFQVTLDYTPDSIKAVEKILGKLHEDYKKSKSMQGINGLAHAFGAYIGEVIRRTEPDVRWERDHESAGEKSYPLHWLGSVSFPCAWAYKRIVNGEEDNVWFKYYLLKSGQHEKGLARVRDKISKASKD